MALNDSIPVDSSDDEITLNKQESSDEEDMEVSFKKVKEQKKVDLSIVVRRSLHEASRRSKAKKSLTPKVSKGRVEKKATKIPRHTGMPNFNKIHEKNFKKMEPIDDYLVRKTERASGLTPGKPILKTKSNKENTSKIPTFSLAPPKIDFASGPVEFTAAEPGAGQSKIPKKVRRDFKQMAASSFVIDIEIEHINCVG